MQTTQFQNFIGGRWVSSESGNSYPVNNPAFKNVILGTAQRSDIVDAKRAIESAHQALSGWAETPAPQRGTIIYRAFELLRTRKSEFAKTITEEEGKSLSDALGEVNRSMNILEYAAGEGRRMFGQTTPSELPNNLAYTTRRPLGVVSIITPWNFPLAIPSWKIGPALICGNTIVFKPATSTPLSGIHLVNLFEEAGLPPGVLNIITGPGSAIGDTLVTHPMVKGISFTGSTDTGSRLYSMGARQLKKVQCEMGGKNAVIVLSDADIEKALNAVVAGAFGSTGQRCTATSRLIIEDAIYDSFISALIDMTKKLRIGYGLLPGIDIGPASSEEQLEQILRYIELGKVEGATLAYGGNRITGAEFDQGFYVEPTIFTDVEANMSIAQEEIFGPVLTCFKVKDFAEAISICNNVQFGLSSSIYTRDLSKAFSYVNQVEAGMLHINAPTLGGEVHLPFGGTKASGVGTREQGTEAINFFSEITTVYVDYAG
ncbi:uncharacterized protein METZ01_LOCUS98415 [marine metagenome]|uniref:Aldehyde dehydrogenase domain-containing protein n=1 Tax=marine metagenome TaxID=408172 RepID=A0A381VZN5_9ZZZZ